MSVTEQNVNVKNHDSVNNISNKNQEMKGKIQWCRAV